MRSLILAPALFFALHAGAQCCCADHVVEIRAAEPVHSAGQWHYTANLNSKVAPYWSMDSVPGDPYILRLRMPTGCGVVQATWKLRSERTGQQMQVELYHLPGDLRIPTIRLPWAAGRTLHFDLRDVLGCAKMIGPLGDEQPMQESICRAGRVRFTVDAGRVLRFEPLEMAPWSTAPPAATVYTATQEARYLDGPDGIQRYLEQQVDKALIEPLPGKVTFTGQAMVEDNGSVYEVTLESTPYAALEEAIRTALLHSGRWQPAVVERRGIPEGAKKFQAIRHTVPVSFTADPEIIWTPIHEFALSILPNEPTSDDSIQLHFQWQAGSCGSYRDTLVITPPTATRPWTDIAVGIGLVGEDCADIALRRRTVVLPPQPAGRYRVRFGESPVDTRSIFGPGPYSYREVVVR